MKTTLRFFSPWKSEDVRQSRQLRPGRSGGQRWFSFLPPWKQEQASPLCVKTQELQQDNDLKHAAQVINN